jgi:hypothetical protein
MLIIVTIKVQCSRYEMRICSVESRIRPDNDGTQMEITLLGLRDHICYSAIPDDDDIDGCGFADLLPQGRMWGRGLVTTNNNEEDVEREP